jgi:hypothetical protein
MNIRGRKAANNKISDSKCYTYFIGHCLPVLVIYHFNEILMF